MTFDSDAQEGSFTLCEMQEKLHADEKGEYSDSLHAFFEQSFNELKKTMDAGLSPDDFPKYQQLLEVTVMADSIVQKYWHLLYGRD